MRTANPGSVCRLVEATALWERMGRILTGTNKWDINTCAILRTKSLSVSLTEFRIQKIITTVSFYYLAEENENNSENECWMGMFRIYF